MSDQSVIIQLSATDAEMVAAWQRARRGPADMEKELQKLGKTGKTAGKEVELSFDSALKTAVAWGGRLKVIGTTLAALRSFAGLVRSEFEEIAQRNQEIARSQIDINSAWRRAASVSGDVSPDSLYQQVVKGANGVDPRELFLTFEAATSAAGNISRQQVLDAVMSTAKQRPDLDLESRTNLSTGALQIQKEFGGTTDESLAAVQQSFQSSRAESLSAFAKNVVPTVVALHQMGGGKDKFEDLMSDAIGFGLATNDPTGERGKTNLINLAKQIKERTVGGGLVSADASFGEMKAALRGDKKLQATLLGPFAQSLGDTPAGLGKKIKKGELTSEAAVFQAAVDLVSGREDSAFMKESKAARQANLGISPQAVASVAARQDQIDNSPFNVATKLSKIGQQGTNEFALLSNNLATAGAARAMIDTKQKELGINWLGRTAAATNFDYVTSRPDFAGTPQAYAAVVKAIVESDIQRLKNREGNLGNLVVSQGEVDAAANMNAFIEELRSFIQMQAERDSVPREVNVKSLPANVAPRPAEAKALND